MKLTSAVGFHNNMRHQLGQQKGKNILFSCPNDFYAALKFRFIAFKLVPS